LNKLKEVSRVKKETEEQKHDFIVAFTEPLESVSSTVQKEEKTISLKTPSYSQQQQQQQQPSQHSSPQKKIEKTITTKQPPLPLQKEKKMFTEKKKSVKGMILKSDDNDRKKKELLNTQSVVNEISEELIQTVSRNAKNIHQSLKSNSNGIEQMMNLENTSYLINLKGKQRFAAASHFFLNISFSLCFVIHRHNVA
jgi:hypothetical protein